MVLEVDGFLSLFRASVSSVALLDLVGFKTGDIRRVKTEDLDGVLTNSCLERDMDLWPEDRPMSLLAGLLLGLSRDVQWVVRGEGRVREDLDGVKVLDTEIVLSEVSSFLGVRDNFMATLDRVLTGVLKLRFGLEGVRNGDWVDLEGVEPPLSGVFRMDFAGTPNLGVGGCRAMLNCTVLSGEKKSSTGSRFLIGVF